MKAEPGAVFVSVPFGPERDPRTGCRPLAWSRAKCERFSRALRGEIELRRTDSRGVAFDTVYFGGCGPSLLTLDELYGMLQSLYDGIAIEPREQTLVVLPGTVDAGKAKVLRESGFDRVDLRPGAPKPTAHDMAVLRAAGFPVIGFELGYPAVTEGWDRRLEELAALKPDHVTLHLPHGRPKSGIALLEAIRTARARLGASLKNYGLHHFCRPGAESRFRESVWHDRLQLGLGPAATTRLGAGQTTNPDHAATYEAAVEAGRLPAPAAYDHRAHRLAGELYSLAGVDAAHVSPPASRTLIARGLIEKRDGRLFLTDQGILVVDRVAAALAGTG